jgi:hypothetical protein
MTNTVIWPGFPFENAMSPDHVTGLFSRFHFHSAIIYCILGFVTPCHLLPFSLFLSFSIWQHLPTHCRCRRVPVASYHIQEHTHSVGSLWTRDRPVSETSTWKHTTLTCDSHPCPPPGFEHAIRANKRSQTNTSERMATVNSDVKTVQ